MRNESTVVSGPTIAFVCVQNAGRSQMATAFAERERERRGADHIEIVSGGTDPADAVHEEVVAAMDELGIDLSDRTPREITPEDLQECEYVITMGCSAEGVCPATWSGENRDWDLTDPHGKDEKTVREIRDEIEARVEALFDEV
ncbi:arsenate-mycothiol transferase ArsC [Halopiger xanaduensis]|uniref:Protein tyrosine phosphatase n=1 Tax=Halopiger xanaduensis (strain DSM 18323 / JCM 14033 / SH-6) TaxID=797210 RepID=F8D7F8_HALXS|nr:ArsC family transcriptional regulator [Halopiger xanaduensis]AEH37879.1 protein tyrosine phosphatase [Halopiger xanaduensis SH-6]